MSGVTGRVVPPGGESPSQEVRVANSAVIGVRIGVLEPAAARFEAASGAGVGVGAGAVDAGTGVGVGAGVADAGTGVGVGVGVGPGGMFD